MKTVPDRSGPGEPHSLSSCQDGVDPGRCPCGRWWGPRRPIRQVGGNLLPPKDPIVDRSLGRARVVGLRIGFPSWRYVNRRALSPDDTRPSRVLSVNEELGHGQASTLCNGG